LTTTGNVLVAEFPDWAFAKDRKVGDAGVVQTDYGFHVIKLEKRTGFDEVKDAAKYVLQLMKYQEELDKWKSDTKYNVVTNKPVYDAIKII
jgi:foldase protein PrsA